jgi:antitoxin HigA-1
MTGENMNYPHPGEILNEEFLKPMTISGSALAKSLGVPQNRISNIINGKLGISADSAMRLARYFGMDAQFWLNLQNQYDCAGAQAKNGVEFSKIKPCAA